VISWKKRAALVAIPVLVAFASSWTEPPEPESPPPKAAPALDLSGVPLRLAAVPVDGIAHAGVTEVTNRQFRRFRREHTSNRYQRRELYAGLDFDADDQPAVATWLEARDFCAWASAVTGRTVRLPTEVEWEAIARAGTTSAWSWGDDPADAHRHANGNDPTTFERLVKGDPAYPQDDRMGDDGFVGTAPVGSFPPNPWGLHDVHGNVAEWTSTRWTGDGAMALDEGDDHPAVTRVHRGGAWNNGPRLMRSDAHNFCNAGNHYDALGFRVVVEAAGP